MGGEGQGGSENQSKTEQPARGRGREGGRETKVETQRQRRESERGRAMKGGDTERAKALGRGVGVGREKETDRSMGAPFQPYLGYRRWEKKEAKWSDNTGPATEGKQKELNELISPYCRLGLRALYPWSHQSNNRASSVPGCPLPLYTYYSNPHNNRHPEVNVFIPIVQGQD